MAEREAFDAVVIGSGPNGLAAAVTLAQKGRSCLVVEQHAVIGGGTRSLQLTLPGFIHDVCSAIHPLGVASPFFRTLPLDQHGLEWVHPRVPLAHPFDDGPAAVLNHEVAATAHTFGDERDEKAYIRLMEPLVRAWPKLTHDALRPMVRLPRHPIALARFGLRGIQSAERLARRHFRGERAAGWFAGLAGHGIIPLEQTSSAAVALMLAAAGHAVGWPMPRGGAQSIADALASYFKSLGGQVRTGVTVASLKDLPPARAYLFDTSPGTLLQVAGRDFPAGYVRRLEAFKHGPGVFKVDWALSGPIPWSDPTCRYAGTVHLGGTFEEIAAAERAPWENQHARRPFVLLAQQSRFDLSRAPAGKHTAWAYCHVPNGSTFDMTERIEEQVERFAPGFRDIVLARHTMNCPQMQRHNPNLVGGDITGGANTLGQLIARPRMFRPYATPDKRFFLCSSSTPPGGGVHGMCGHFAALAALRRTLR
jgi:phytoene dehydrogenase-like protein